MSSKFEEMQRNLRAERAMYWYIHHSQYIMPISCFIVLLLLVIVSNVTVHIKRAQLKLVRITIIVISHCLEKCLLHKGKVFVARGK